MIRFACPCCYKVLKSHRCDSGLLIACPRCRQPQSVPEMPLGVLSERAIWYEELHCIWLASLATLATAAIVGIALWFQR